MTEQDHVTTDTTEILESEKELNEPGSSADADTQLLHSLREKLSKLEKIIRGAGRDNLSLVRGQKDNQTKLETLLLQFSDLELNIKGLTQTVWKATQESSEQLQKAEQHFAGAIRELDAHVREEIQWQIHKNTLQTIFPSLDDMDLIISKQKELTEQSGEENGLLEAMIMVRRKFDEGLRKLGLEQISIEINKTKFDPGIHEAVESDGSESGNSHKSAPKGTIINIKRPGYFLNGKIFRAPKVQVKN